MDSQRLEEAVGMPVVNMGVHAGLGNAFLDNMAKDYVREGDLVIVVHTEYADDDKILNEQLAWITIENHFELWKNIRENILMHMEIMYFQGQNSRWSLLRVRLMSRR